jgi:NADPH:quinone reductase-like Zn-dependent oxidoreductase
MKGYVPRRHATDAKETPVKAIVRYKYGSPDVLELQEIEKPVVNDDHVLVRVCAASLNLGDWHAMRGRPYIIRLMGLRLRTPKDRLLGGDLAGRVEAVGRNVTEFRPGDEVFGMSIRTLAEYVAVRDIGLVRKPANVTFEQAAAVPVAAITALQGLRDVGAIQPGQEVLINGASGGVGTFAVQIAKVFGANVTGVCSTRNVDLVRSIGADRVIDYTREDFTRTGQRYDLIFDLAGNHSLSEYKRVLKPKGALVLAGQTGRKEHSILPFFKTRLLAPFVRYRLRSFFASRKKEDLNTLKGFLETGKIKPVIDRTYPLREVPEAMRYIGTLHARGKVVITV